MLRKFTIAAAGLLLASSLPALAAKEPSLTPAGFGAAKMGMTPAQVERALNVKLRPFSQEDRDINDQCHDTNVIGAGYPGMSFMFERGLLTRIGVHQGADGGFYSSVKTPRGVGLGAKEADVRRLYGPTLIVGLAEYDEEPAHSLLFWLKPGESGVRFVTDQKGVVNRIYAGTRAIEYIEGCA